MTAQAANRASTETASNELTGRALAAASARLPTGASPLGTGQPARQHIVYDP